MELLTTIAALRAWRARSGTVGLVPTMGALHDGHLALVAAATTECDRAVASVFVNPSQFDDPADLARYPRDLERDRALLEAAGCHALFAPAVAEVYPAGFDTWVEPGAVAVPNEGAHRPGHFRGVATVVLKLLNMVQPERAYFGQKDAQQLAVIRAMVRDLDVPVAIVPSPTVREPDGLAMSSRNARLSPSERRAARAVPRALLAARAAHRAGVRDVAALRRAAFDVLADEPQVVAAEYVSIADGATMAEIAERPEAGAVVSLAVRLGATRLIDNIVLGDDRLSGLDRLDLDALAAGGDTEAPDPTAAAQAGPPQETRSGPGSPSNRPRGLDP